MEENPEVDGVGATPTVDARGNTPPYFVLGASGSSSSPATEALAPTPSAYKRSNVVSPTHLDWPGGLAHSEARNR